MSYCRWSSDDFRCDVYVYADCRGGWTIHVAGARHVPVEPLPPPLDLPHGLLTEGTREEREAWGRAFADRCLKVDAIIGRSPTVKIGLAHDGETFNVGTPGAAAELLERLRADGYNVPQYAIDELREEGKADAGGRTTE